MVKKRQELSTPQVILISLDTYGSMNAHIHSQQRNSCSRISATLAAFFSWILTLWAGKGMQHDLELTVED